MRIYYQLSSKLFPRQKVQKHLAKTGYSLRAQINSQFLQETYNSNLTLFKFWLKLESLGFWFLKSASVEFLVYQKPSM